MKTPKPNATTVAKQPTTVIVTVSDDACKDLAAVRRRLEEAGMAVDDVLEFLGQITGKWSSTELEPLRSIEGVVDVSESREFQLAPPDSPVQ